MNKPLRLLLALSFSLGACVATEEGDDLPCDSPNTFYPDADGDGYGDDALATRSCEMSIPAGFVLVGGDCRDDVKAANPGGREICDTIDNDCDGKMDDADSSLDPASKTSFYKDGDKDGFGNPDEDLIVTACAAPLGYVASKTDCDDTRASVNPSAKEICDDLDNDCDGKWDISDPSLDMTTATKYYRDADNDQHGAGTVQLACDQPWGWVAANDVGSSRVDLQACKLEYSIVSPK